MQLKTAIEQPPHLKAIFPTHLVADYYHDAYAGGVLSLFQYGVFHGRAGTSGFAARNVVSEMMKTLPPEEIERRRQALLADPDIRYFPNLYHLLHYPFKNPQFFDILLNPLDGPYWRDRSIYPFYDRIKVPAYIIGKCARGASFWDIYNGIDTVKKILVKPTEPEERPWREDIELVIRWYDHWLKGIDTGLMEEPPIKMWVTGANRWRYEQEWPLPGTEWTPCYLRRWEGLSFAPELFQNEPDCYLQQPLYLSNKRDSVVYLSPPMPENLEVIGPASLKLFASIDQDDTNWIVRVQDVAPNGSAAGVCGGYLKASHRALDTEKSTPVRPHYKNTSIEPVKPGEIYEYDIDLGAVSNVFTAGHRIKLSIGSMESPRDPEMQVHFHPHLCSSRTTLHKVYRDREHRSHLLLPVIGKRPALTEVLSDDNML
jgi:predicted acyl esterase